jgi:hypothetical protein
MRLPGFTAGSLNMTALDYRVTTIAASGTSSEEVLPQFRCLVYAAMCLAITEDIPLAGWCWYGFANACGGAMA